MLIWIKLQNNVSQYNFINELQECTILGGVKFLNFLFLPHQGRVFHFCMESVLKLRHGVGCGRQNLLTSIVTNKNRLLCYVIPDISSNIQSNKCYEKRCYFDASFLLLIMYIPIVRSVNERTVSQPSETMMNGSTRYEAQNIYLVTGQK